MYQNGSVSKKIRYKDICTDKFLISVAYNNDYVSGFEIVNESMVEFPVDPVKGLYSSIPYPGEILSAFLENHNIFVQWINCNFTWGWFDDESETWTGAVGQVKHLLMTTRKKHDS